MDYQPLPLGRMQECGSSLLKSLQNDSMVPLDLLVRESIQNSLDAAAGQEPVKFEFKFVEHATETVSGLLGGPVAQALRKRYPAKTYRQLIVRDRNTVGLTGPFKLDELASGKAQGNFFKLVYAVGRSQDEAHRGGSWGLGKTIYFRIGCGLVFYYTRIRTEVGFEERLAACLVEDERHPENLQKDSQTGIAWWGSGKEGPVLDTAEIAKVLSALDVPRFRGDETGTVVIVPFLSDNLGPPEVEPDEQSTPSTPLADTPWWHRSYSDYVRVAIQRWYGVRLNNARFPAAPLHAAVDGVVITDRDTQAVIKIARQLYQSCVDGVTGPRQVRAPFGDDPISVEVDEITPLQRVVKGTHSVGRVAMALVTRQQLGMDAPHNLPAPQSVLFGSRHTGAAVPIVGFLRRPGMIVQWDGRGDRSGWAWKVPQSSEGQYLLAVVVPDGDLELHADAAEKAGLISGASHTLEGYLRNCEKADHNDWIDPVGLTIVKRMRLRVAERLQLLSPQEDVASPTSRPFLGARTVADRLLPVGFGKDGRRDSDDGGVAPSDKGSARNRSTAPRLEIRKLEYKDYGFTLHWRLLWSGNPAAADLRLLIDTEGSPVSKENWKKDGLGNFPLTVRHAKVVVVNTSDKRNNSWSVSVEKHSDMPGIRVVPKGSQTGRGLTVTADGTLDVAVTNPKGAPVRSILMVDRVASETS